MSGQGKIRDAVREELLQGTSRSQIFVNIGKLFDYKEIDPETAEQWFQFVQEHRKYSPDLCLDKDQKKLMEIVLEEAQKMKSKVIEWTEPKICDVKFVSPRLAMGVKTHKGKVCSLVQFDIAKNTQKEIPVQFDIPVINKNELSKVHLECVNESLFIIVVVLETPLIYPSPRGGPRGFGVDEPPICHRSFVYLIGIDVDHLQANLIQTRREGHIYNQIVFNQQRPDTFCFLAKYDRPGFYSGRVDDTGMWMSQWAYINKNSFAYRAGNNEMEYLHYAPNKGFSVRKVPIEDAYWVPKDRHLYDVDADDRLFDWNILNAPYKWSGHNCYIAKQLKSDLIDQCILCHFNESKKKLERTGIQLVGKCVDLTMESEDKLLICVHVGDRFVIHRFKLGQVHTLFNLSLLAVRRHSTFYTSKQREKLMEQLTEKLQTFRFDD
ncbi:hypothetical protein M3Y97_01058000 [Aphelenchoides bicaudatus]|nr:hypothetical protein M3Y97_01058000 [Aphelenchoides bicaudatus]